MDAAHAVGPGVEGELASIVCYQAGPRGGYLLHGLRRGAGEEKAALGAVDLAGRVRGLADRARL